MMKKSLSLTIDLSEASSKSSSSDRSMSVFLTRSTFETFVAVRVFPGDGERNSFRTFPHISWSAPLVILYSIFFYVMDRSAYIYIYIKKRTVKFPNPHCGSQVQLYVLFGCSLFISCGRRWWEYFLRRDFFFLHWRLGGALTWPLGAVLCHWNHVRCLLLGLFSVVWGGGRWSRSLCVCTDSVKLFIYVGLLSNIANCL